MQLITGVTDALSEPQCVLLQGNLIAAIGPDVAAPAGLRCTEVDIEGRTLMPGLIDMHAHVCFQEGMKEGINYDQMAMGAMAGHDLVRSWCLLCRPRQLYVACVRCFPPACSCLFSPSVASLAVDSTL